MTANIDKMHPSVQPSNWQKSMQSPPFHSSKLHTATDWVQSAQHWSKLARKSDTSAAETPFSCCAQMWKKVVNWYIPLMRCFIMWCESKLDHDSVTEKIVTWLERSSRLEEIFWTWFCRICNSSFVAVVSFNCKIWNTQQHSCWTVLVDFQQDVSTKKTSTLSQCRGRAPQPSIT